MANRDLILFYDGDCGLCEAAINWLIKNVDSDVRTIQYQDQAELKKFNNLNKYLINKEIQLIKGKSMYSGAKAIGFCLKNKSLNIYKIIGYMILYPFILPFAKICYRIIANNRIMISKFLRLNQCKIKN